ncbi:MAG: 16S rRNA (adenine(1518)-N(6)/adenine(1519)-N(6))-dimethyltransferase RsmA [Acidobacteriota bacterium]
MKARRRFAQHFLDGSWVARLLAAIDPQPADVVLEIGPGRGAITAPLARAVSRLVAVEVDRDLAAALAARVVPHVTVVTADILDVDLASLLARALGGPIGPDRGVRVVGNLPYNITSPILFRLFDLAAATGGVTDACLMVQKEVADRLVADPGTKDYGVLTVFTALYADVTRLLRLPPGAFRPRPKVESAVVRLAFRPPSVAPKDPVLFEGMVRSMFTQRRKTLANALRPFSDARGLPAAEALRRAGLDSRRRPETLQVVEMARLADVFAVADLA